MAAVRDPASGSVVDHGDHQLRPRRRYRAGGELRLRIRPGVRAERLVSQSIQVTYERTTSKEYDTFASLAFDASTQTAFYDEVWYTAQAYTMYSYPAIGQTACPAGSASCDPTYPLYITLSGPTVNTQVNAQGAGLEWYQPVHEIGQVFSYPANQTLLEARIDDPSEPLSSAVAFDTDTSSSAESVSWSVSQSETVTAATSTTYSFETDNSITGGTPYYSLGVDCGGVPPLREQVAASCDP